MNYFLNALHRYLPDKDTGAVGQHVELERLIDILDTGRFTKPELEPQPLRRIVFLAAEFSEQAQGAFRRTLQLAEFENCERLYVIRSYTSFDKARARRQIRGNTGFASSNFVQSVDANLLVVPWEKKLSARNSWVTEVIPCNLWLVR